MTAGVRLYLYSVGNREQASGPLPMLVLPNRSTLSHHLLSVPESTSGFCGAAARSTSGSNDNTCQHSAKSAMMESCTLWRLLFLIKYHPSRWPCLARCLAPIVLTW